MMSKTIVLEQQVMELNTEIRRLKQLMNSGHISTESFDRERFDWEDIQTSKKFNDAIDRLRLEYSKIVAPKRIEDVRTKNHFYVCGSCGRNITMSCHFCPVCGSKINWDAYVTVNY